MMKTIKGLQGKILIVPLTVISILLLFPLYWMFMASFMTDIQATSLPPHFFPPNFSLGNYIEIFKTAPALKWFLNSIIASGLTTVITLLISATAGYAFAKKSFPGRDVIFFSMVFTLMIPRHVLMIPLFKLINQFGITNTYYGLILPELGRAFGVFMMRQFIQTLPNEIMQSAEIDGAGEIRTFSQIVLPMTKPALGALAIFTFVTSWNDYLWQLLVISSREKKTLPLGIAGFREEFSMRMALLMAGATIAALPIIVVFLIFQQYFTKGITMGAIKG